MTTGSNSSINSYLNMFKPAANLSVNGDDEGCGEDVMYNSLRRLNSSTPKQQPTKKTARKLAKITYQNSTKELEFTLNDIYHTDGNSPIKKCDNHKTLSKKKVKSIGTSPDYFVLSDMISIDIDPESTRLPLMCKLMIIVEGAALERGTRNLVRDASVQTGHNEVDIVIHTEKKVKFNTTLERHRSNESITHEAYNQLLNNKANRLITGGSMTNLNKTTTEDNSYFNVKRENSENEDVKELAATPYYQYQRKNVRKCDFSSYVNEECFESFVQVNKATNTDLLTTEHEVEVLIPIKIVPETHRNEKHIFITNNNNSNNQVVRHSDFYVDDLDARSMRRFMDERVNRFEAEITFFNLSDRISQPVISFTEKTSHLHHHPVTYSYHVHQTKNNLHHQHLLHHHQQQQQHYQQYHHFSRSEPSVTNMMIMQVVDGQLIE